MNTPYAPVLFETVVKTDQDNGLDDKDGIDNDVHTEAQGSRKVDRKEKLLTIF